MKLVKKVNDWEIFERKGRFLAKDFSIGKRRVSAASIKKVEKKIRRK